MYKDYLLKELDRLDKTSSFYDANKIAIIYDAIKNAKDDGKLLQARQNPHLHLSASAVVFDQDKLIFITHPYLHKILLPAGHVELGERPIDTAFREFHEETGFKADLLKDAKLVDINLIYIPDNPQKEESEHFHIDFRYLLNLASDKAKDTAELAVSYLDMENSPEEFKRYFQYV